MFYSIPYHLRQGVVDKSEASQDEIDYEQGDRSNALKNVEVVDEDNSGGSEVSAVTDGSELPPDLKNARFVSTGHWGIDVFFIIIIIDSRFSLYIIELLYKYYNYDLYFFKNFYFL